MFILVTEVVFDLLLLLPLFGNRSTVRIYGEGRSKSPKWPPDRRICSVLGSCNSLLRQGNGGNVLATQPAERPGHSPSYSAAEISIPTLPS